MSRLIIVWILAFSGLTLLNRQPQATDPVTGTWKGTSICQVKDSPCRDEIAIYHATKLPGGKIYRFQMNKMVDNKEVEMGSLDFTYDDKVQTLIAENNSPKGKGSWSFKISGKTMHGTLTVENNVLYRIIDLHKAD